MIIIKRKLFSKKGAQRDLEKSVEAARAAGIGYTAYKHHKNKKDDKK